MQTSHLVVSFVVSLEAYGSSVYASWSHKALVVLAAVSPQPL